MLSAPRDWFKWSLSSGAPTGSPGLLEPHTERITRLAIHHAASKRESHARAVRSERPFRHVPWHDTLRCILATEKKNEKTSGGMWCGLLSSAAQTAKEHGINCTSWDGFYWKTVMWDEERWYFVNTEEALNQTHTHTMCHGTVLQCQFHELNESLYFLSGLKSL